MTQKNPLNTSEVTRITNELKAAIGTEFTSDIIQECTMCGTNFTISVDEQKWFASLGYPNPKRCKACRRIRKAERRGFNRGRKEVLNAISAINESIINKAE